MVPDLSPVGQAYVTTLAIGSLATSNPVHVPLSIDEEKQASPGSRQSWTKRDSFLQRHVSYNR